MPEIPSALRADEQPTPGGEPDDDQMAEILSLAHIYAKENHDTAGIPRYGEGMAEALILGGWKLVPQWYGVEEEGTPESDPTDDGAVADAGDRCILYEHGADGMVWCSTHDEGIGGAHDPLTPGRVLQHLSSVGHYRDWRFHPSGAPRGSDPYEKTVNAPPRERKDAQTIARAAVIDAMSGLNEWMRNIATAYEADSGMNVCPTCHEHPCTVHCYECGTDCTAHDVAHRPDCQQGHGIFRVDAFDAIYRQMSCTECGRRFQFGDRYYEWTEGESVGSDGGPFEKVQIGHVVCEYGGHDWPEVPPLHPRSGVKAG